MVIVAVVAVVVVVVKCLSVSPGISDTSMEAKFRPMLYGKTQ